jgi:hypothetical protein
MNFGVYQPPSGIDNIRRSTQINSINNLNNPAKTFDEMIEQGWGGNIPSPLSPSSSSSPSPPPSSFVPLPPGNLTPAQINAAMQTRTCSNPCVVFHFSFLDDQPWDAERGVWITPPALNRRETLCWGSVPGETGPNDEEFGWISFGSNMGADALQRYVGPGSEAVLESFFTVDSATRARCFSPPPSPSPSPSLGGNASPPPPPGKNMCGCDCNTIATIVEDKVCGVDKGIKNHIDQRTIEELKAVNKMLQNMKIDLNLQPIIDRLNQVEANLWNGPTGG